MPRKKSLAILITVLVFSMNLTAFANYSDNSSFVWTGVIQGPSIRPGYDRQSNQYNISSEIFTSCFGKNCRLRTRSMGTINSNFASDNNRIFTMELWERDSSNSDDLVLIYKGTFSGRKLITFSQYEIVDSGLIDSENDCTAEFYTMSRLSKCSSYEWGEVFSGSFCTYEIGMR